MSRGAPATFTSKISGSWQSATTWTSSIGSAKQPSHTNTVTFNCYSDPFAVWLTHNAGAPYSSSGDASIKQYVWGTNSSLAGLACTAYPMQSASELFYNATVLPIATAFFASEPVGTVTNFPLTGAPYDIPHMDESPAWVSTYLSGITETFSSFDTNGLLWTALADDAYTTIGRGRLLSHKATYTIQKKPGLFGGDYLEVISVRYSGVVEDIYDFNAEDQGVGGNAAIVELGHGNDGYGGARPSGIIFKERIEFDQAVSDPF